MDYSQIGGCGYQTMTKGKPKFYGKLLVIKYIVYKPNYQVVDIVWLVI